ncbi:MAG: ATP-binding protein, partial [Oscillospiraceae bacterium]|nr:ATP-binding protein [Oscillospiraceae bacterium]
MAGDRYFNTEGLCRPNLHYMVDIAGKVDTIVRDYVDRGRYFVINRARQYGKTTTLGMLARRLSGQYLVFRASFEGSESFFVSHKTMAGGICRLLYNQLNRMKSAFADLFAPPIDEQFPMDDFSERITRLCEQSEQPV